MSDTERKIVDTGRCPDCQSDLWFWGPQGGLSSMYRSPCGLWVIASPFGAEIVDRDPDRWFNEAARCVFGGEKGSYELAIAQEGK